MKAAFLTFCIFAGVLSCRAEDPQLLRTKAELLVEEAGAMYEEASRARGDALRAPCKYYLGLMYSCGTNLLARPVNADNMRTLQKYVQLVEKDYDAYTRVTAAQQKAAATQTYRGKSGGRQRAARMLSADRLGERELTSAIKRWEEFASRLKRSRK